MAITRLQYKSAGASSATVAVTFDSATTTGSLLVACVSCYYGNNGGNLTNVAISDDKGNTAQFQSAVRRDGQIANGGGGWCEIFYCPNITGGATHTVTATLSGSSLYGQITVFEYAGAATSTPLDQTASDLVTTTNTFSSGSATTTQADEVIVGLVHYTSATVTATPSTGTVVDYAAAGVGDRHGAIEAIVSATNSYSIAGSLSEIVSGVITALMATFKAATGGGGGGSTTDGLIIISGV